MKLWTWIAKAWRKRLRKSDMEMLWPSCVAQAKDLDHAKMAFAVHAFNDEAWTKDYTHDQIKEIINDLEATP